MSEVDTKDDQSISVEPAVLRDGPSGKRTIGRRGRELIEAMAREGRADASIAKALRMHRETLRMIRRRDSQVEEALQRGRSALEDELTDLLLTKARGGCVVSTIYLTKARLGWREGELPPGATVVNAENVQIQMAPMLSDEQFERLLDRGGSG